MKLYQGEELPEFTYINVRSEWVIIEHDVIEYYAYLQSIVLTHFLIIDVNK